MDFSGCWRLFFSPAGIKRRAERNRAANSEEQSAEEYQQELVALFGVLSGKIITRILCAAKARFDRTALRAEMRELVAMACYKPLWDNLHFRIAIWNIVEAQIAECYRDLKREWEYPAFNHRYGTDRSPDEPKKRSDPERPNIESIRKRICQEMTQALNQVRRRTATQEDLRRGLRAAVRVQKKGKNGGREEILQNILLRDVGEGRGRGERYSVDWPGSGLGSRRWVAGRWVREEWESR